MQRHQVDAAGSVSRLRNWKPARGVRIAVAAAALVLVAVIVIPFFVNADTFRPLLENEISSALGRKVTLGRLSFSLFSGSLKANNITVADDPKFSSTPFLQAKSLEIGVATGAFLFDHQVRITKLVADSPVIHLISGPSGTWNFSSLGQSGTPAAKQQNSGSAPNVTVGDLKIQNGSVDVSSVAGAARPFVYSKVNISVRHLSYTQAMPFSVSADMPGDGSVQLSGTAGPLNQQNAADTPLRATLEVKHFDPVSAGVLPASEGISMVADIHAQVTSDGKKATSSGKITAAHLLLSRDGSPAPQPVDIDYTVFDNLNAQNGQVQDVAIHTGSVAAHLNGSFQTAGQAVTLDLHLSAPNLPIDQLEQLLPAIGIRLPSGSSLKGGTLTANLAISGTTTAPDITGPVEIDNTQLAGFSLGSKIQGLKALGGTGNVTAIDTLRADVHSTVPSTELSNIYADVPAIGTATGAGTVSAAGALDFHLVAKLSSSGGVGAVVNGAASALGTLAGGLLHSAANNGIPVSITGTTSDPDIRANLGAMLKGGGKNAAQQKTNPGGLLKGLLGHR